MTTILSIFGANGIFYALGAAVVAAFAFYMKSLGRKAERDKQAREEAKARDVADEVENDVDTLTPAQRRERLKSWSKS